MKGVININNIKKKETYHKNYYPEENKGICVVKRKGEKDEDLLKRFKKKFAKSGVLREAKERMYYEKPSDKKRRKKNQMIRNLKREEQKQNMKGNSDD